MQIKEFYLDLKEWPQYGKKNHNVWLLESEAFKEPLRFKFAFDSEDDLKLERIKNSCQDYYDLILKKESTFNEIINKLEDKLRVITISYQKLEEISEKYDKILEQIKEKEKLIKDKELEENNKIKEIKKEVNIIKEKLDLPEPKKIYSKQWEEFIVWDDTYYWAPFILQPWEYYIIEKYEYEPQNEYVQNIDEIKIKQMYIKDEGYIPEIQLLWSNAIDKPVSKVKLYVLFFKI